MPENPITVPLPQDLPTNWVYGQTIGPNGTDVGLTQQYGYNYLMQQVNAAQQAAEELGEEFPNLYGEGSVVPVKGGGTGSKNTQNALNTLGAGVPPNLLHNAYFFGGGSQQGGGQLPVNQQGQTSYGTGITNAFDRWEKDSSASVELTSTGLVVTSPSSPGSRAITQAVEDYNKLSGQDLTLSVLAFGTGSINLGYNAGSSIYQGEAVLTQSPALISYSFMVPDNPSNFNAIIRSVLSTTENSIAIMAAKLEFGTSQTLAYQDNGNNWHLLPQTDMNFGIQLLLCQRYYQLYSSADERPAKAIDCRPVMRIDPTQGTIIINDVTYYYNDATL